LYIEWLAVTPTDSLVIDGYKLAMIKLGTGDSTIVYDGSENSERLFYNVTGLETGQRYTFSVVSVNFNGVSEPSDELVAVVCKPPKGFPRPQYVSSTKSSITISWQAPSDTGGCPLLTYELYMNDGLGGGDFFGIDSQILEDRPYIIEHTITAEAGVDPATSGGALVTG